MQVHFEDPVLISSGFDPDLIEVSFYQTERWLVTDNKYELHVPNGYFI